MRDAEREVLRRRVYARGAGADDVAALRRLGSRRRRRAGGIAALAVVVLAVAAAPTWRPPPDPAAAVGAALPAGRPVQRLSGMGPALVAIGGAGAPDVGRLTVVFALARDARGGWTALRLGTEGSPVVVLLPVARRIAPRRAGSTATTTVRYRLGERPVRLRVDAPAGTRWAAAVTER